MMGRISAGCSGWLLVGVLLAAMPRASVANDVRLADMAQDLELLKRQVAILRSEVEDLRRVNAQLKATVNAGAASGKGSREIFRAYSEKMDRDFDDFRRVVAGSNAIHKEQLLKEVNGKLAELARQMKVQIDALAKALRRPAPPPPTGAHPKTGVVYKVKKGDTLSGIARSNKSKVSWIKSANGIVLDTALQAGRDIFVPQED